VAELVGDALSVGDRTVFRVPDVDYSIQRARRVADGSGRGVLFSANSAIEFCGVVSAGHFVCVHVLAFGSGQLGHHSADFIHQLGRGWVSEIKRRHLDNQFSSQDFDEDAA
jgi:hypothetical protein